MSDQGDHEDSPLAGYLTLPQVAERLRINIKTVERMKGDGRLPAIKIGMRHYVASADVSDYVEKLRAAAKKGRGKEKVIRSPKRPRPQAVEPEVAAG